MYYRSITIKLHKLLNWHWQQCEVNAINVVLGNRDTGRNLLVEIVLGMEWNGMDGMECFISEWNQKSNFLLY